jgi:hypothetical protein
VVEIADDRAQQMMSTIDLGIGGTDKKELLEFVEECEVLSDEPPPSMLLSLLHPSVLLLSLCSTIDFR